MRKLSVLVGMCCVLMVGCSTTQGTKDALDAKDAKQQVAKKSYKDKLVCEKTAKVGTRMKSRRCITKEQAAAERENARKAAEHISRKINIPSKNN
ncbi:hypothetical protein [Pleionea sp. CnH1-48]|uniref:hypothetical protein n=1 Tax=Pleionea sp. CnH1-48 TaxID=2954494 RepID=UPI002097BAFB|nr:hypothetical protein [Pleionea sp. CnH1-48]MCO7225022.1 hypothetical protein [Pleionea sp. CnH1-48]